MNLYKCWLADSQGICPVGNSALVPKLSLVVGNWSKHWS